MPLGRVAGVAAIAGALALATASTASAVPFSPNAAQNANDESKLTQLITEFAGYSQGGDGGFDVRRFVGSARAALQIAKSSGALPNGNSKPGAAGGGGWLLGAVNTTDGSEAATAAMALVSTQDTGGPFTPEDGSGLLGDDNPFSVVTGQTTTGDVPLPPGILLLGSASALLVFMRRRRVSSE